jgi:hypothetical protein
VAVFKDSSDLDSELLSAYVALVEALTVALPVQLPDALGSAAMRAYRAFGPELRFNVRVRGLFVVETWVRNN